MSSGQQDITTPLRRQPFWVIYAFALAITAAFLALQRLTLDWFGEQPLLIFLFAFPVLLSGYLGGLGPGLTATAVAVSGIVALPASHAATDAGATDNSDLSRLFMFILIGGLASLLFGIVKRARQQQEQVLSDLRCSEAAFAASQKLLAGVVSTAMDAIITADAARRIVLFNAAAEKMFGCSAATAVGASIEDFVLLGFCEADGECHSCVMLNDPEGRCTKERCTVDGRRANGQSFPAEASISVAEVDGRRWFTIILRDVTERLQTEVALRERLELQNQIAQVAASVPGVVCSFRLHPDGSACAPYCSPAFEDLYGIDPQAVVEDFGPVFMRIHPDDLSQVYESIAESARTLEPWRYVFRYRHPIKGEVWIEGHSMPLGEPDGSVLWHGYIRDITHDKRAEEVLRASEARLRLAIEALDAGLWDRDLRSGEVYFSPEWKRQLGYGEDELPARWEEWENRIHDEDRDRVLSETESFVAGRSAQYELEYRVRLKDRSYRWIHTRGALLRDEHDQPYRMVGMNFDVTERKKTQELRGRGKELEESFRHYVAIQTAAAIAHELNQPLAAIASYIEVALVLLRANKPDMDKLRYSLESGEQQVQRAGQATRQLLKLLQKGETVSEDVDLNATVRDAIVIFKADNDLGGFSVGLELTPDLPRVQANRSQMEKVLINLLRNGLDAMREAGMASGMISVSTKVLSPDDMALVTVCDCGGGVDTESRQSIFQPFYTTKARGLGMGLAVSRSLVEAHGGKLWLDTEAPSGTCFHFTLPFAS
ncbi:PAS domain-containing protein [Methylococcus sp. EFPC2]|uniref:PAS domain-containing protein n=1 Tax=Methylococcus sp. EFPC2 TaxID=2812648 RepID=UPI00196735B0|nr:PAS domain-containing protein [Methylococcus sp. EFPC2]QSA98605.1 PAS domain-containing protein [Methylococcus sp. EFPC2]